LSNKIKKKYNKKEVAACYMLLALPIIGFFVFTLYPFFWAGKISFFSYDGIDSHTAWVGWQNYVDAITNSGYWKAWRVNLIFFIIKMPLEMLLAFVTANLLMAKTKFSGFYRSVYFLPAIVSAAIVGLIFSNLFDFFGVINTYLVKFGIVQEPINWYANTWTAIFMVIFTTLWQSFGINVLYFLAALSNVSKDVMESADLDGAGTFTQLFKIKLPMILPMLQVMMLLGLNGILQLNDVVLVLTNGAPGGTTHTISSYLTSHIVPGFGKTSDIGYAAAMSIITSIIFCIIGISFNKLSTKIKERY